MAKYPLSDLLRVRLLREDKAMELLLVARKKVEEAFVFLNQKKDELSKYRVFRVNEENRLYDTIMGKKVPRTRVDEIKAEVAALQAEELAYEKRVIEAEASLEAAEKNLAQAQDFYQQAVRNRQKIEEHRTIWLEEDRKIREFLLEKELEDFRRRESEFEDDEALPA